MGITGDAYSLIIANNKYRDKLLSEISFSLKDVNELVKLLKNPNIGNFKKVKKLENCSSAKVNEALEFFFKVCTKNDLLLFYFSGHGIEDDLGNLYLSVINTKLNGLRSTAIPINFIGELLNISGSHTKIIILDCRFTRILTKEMHIEYKSSIDFSHWFQGHGRIVLASSPCIQYVIYRDGFKQEKNKSLFTHYLVQGLRTGKADINGDGLISIDELYNYISGNIIKNKHKQLPKIWIFNKTDNVVIAKGVLGEIKNQDHIEIEQGKTEKQNKNSKSRPHYIITKKGWKNLIRGKEYTFFFLYLAIDKPAIIAEQSPELLEKEAKCLQNYINRHLKGTKGKIWLNKTENYEQVILFPYDGKNMERVLRCAFHILLYKNLFDFEESCLEDTLSFKLALHLGNTHYYPNPANIPLVSKDINFIFHFGGHIEPEFIYITEDAKIIMPPEFHQYFIPLGEFNSKDIYRINFKFNNECIY